MRISAPTRPLSLFIAGMTCGWMVLAAGRYVVNQSAVPDRLVAPLMLADTSNDVDVIVTLGAGAIGECTPNMNGVRRVTQAVRLSE